MNIIALAKIFLVERWRYVFILHWMIGWYGGAMSDHLHLPTLPIIIPSILLCLFLNARHYKALQNYRWL